jgi:hypothetical protein
MTKHVEAAYELKWGEPPPIVNKPRAGVWALRLAPLKDRPGEWACIGRFFSSTAAAIRKGRLEGVPAGDYETTLRDYQRPPEGDNKGDLYVRYIGHLKDTDA